MGGAFLRIPKSILIGYHSARLKVNKAVKRILSNPMCFVSVANGNTSPTVVIVSDWQAAKRLNTNTADCFL
jgi:hypothetical protein